jgi:predicted dehydrogenase
MILCVLYEIFENIWPATADLLPRAAVMATVAEQPLTDLLSMSPARKDGAGERLRLAIVGMGLVGRRHVAAINQISSVEICAVVDADDAITAQVANAGIESHNDLCTMINATRPDGIILSTPTNLHMSQALACIESGIPILIEKPIAHDLAAAQLIVSKSDALGVPVMVGHHRRFNPIIQKAKDVLTQGLIGTIRVVDAKCWFAKPNDYFETAPWRKINGAGPVSVNLVHDIDLLRFLCGEIIEVRAIMAPSARGHDIEDVAVAIFRFENGALGTVSVSDNAVSPWSWEVTSGEYPIYPFTGQSAYQIGGSRGALSVPDLRIWQHEGEPDWWSPIDSTVLSVAMADPLVNQIRHFAAVICGEIKPLVSGYEGLCTLAVIDSMREAAKTGRAICPADLIAVDKTAAEENMSFTAKEEAHVRASPAWTNQTP